MKKTTLSLVAVLALGFTANAQTPDVKIGVKGGLNISNLTNTTHGSSLTGFHIGGVAEIFVNQKFSIQPEILFSYQGSAYDGPYMLDNKLVNIDSKTELGYINIPVMAKYYIVKGLNLQVGPQFGFLTNAKYKIDSATLLGHPLPIEDSNVSIKDAYNTFDFGINFGAGYELPVGVFFDARYNVGLTNVNKYGNSSNNGVFQLSVGYKF
ncbi:MAG: PorT family protein [Myroides sp.]|jgi:hypothetical protein|nr:PorT family protein [Myroides sp.]